MDIIMNNLASYEFTLRELEIKASTLYIKISDLNNKKDLTENEALEITCLNEELEGVEKQIIEHQKHIQEHVLLMNECGSSYAKEEIKVYYIEHASSTYNESIEDVGLVADIEKPGRMSKIQAVDKNGNSDGIKGKPKWK